MNTMFITANIISDALKPLIDVFGWLLVEIYGVLGSWGLSIIGLTILVRAVLIPLTIKQIRSMQAMQAHQPEIKAIQAKYKGKPEDSATVKAEKRQKLNEELMGFYKENKINPLASCLPLAAQMPVFISLFYLLRERLKVDICPEITTYAASIHKTVNQVSCGQVPGSTEQKFLFIPDLTTKATGAVLVTLIVLYVGSQLGSSLMMTTTMDKTQRNIMLAMPLMFVFFILNFPAGLILYWITTNTWTVGQQYVVKRLSGGVKLTEPSGALMAADSALAEVEIETSGFMSRLRGAADSAKEKQGSSVPEEKKESGDSKAKKPEGKTSGGTDKPKAKGGPPPSKKNRKRTGRRR